MDLPGPAASSALFGSSGISGHRLPRMLSLQWEGAQEGYVPHRGCCPAGSWRTSLWELFQDWGEDLPKEKYGKQERMSV